jgi:hypothetical protein
MKKIISILISFVFTVNTVIGPLPAVWAQAVPLTSAVNLPDNRVNGKYE